MIVVDWDGTVTETDTQHMALLEFGDADVLREAGELLDAGEITLHECIEREFETLREPLETVLAWLVPRVRIRPGFHELAARHRPLILSSSFRQVIEPVLVREGLELEVLANDVDARLDGWRPIWRDSARCADCDEACKRASLPANGIVYVGDGYSDRCAALAADRVFARDGLARYLDERGAPYEPFEDFRDVLRALP